MLNTINKMKRPIHLLIFLAVSISACAQKENQSIIFYNVENLFDTLDTKDKIDEEFLPNGKREWNTSRYNDKLGHINQVLGEFQAPLAIGLCEIENEQVVRDIINYGDLKGKYGIVHFESLDARGIDNAIIYDSAQLTIVRKGILRFDMPEGSSPSRDIVWAQFRNGLATFYVMVNHWPSRRGGQVESEPKRLIAATAAREFVDSLLTVDKKSKIIFMGDLNDTPENRAPQMMSAVLKPMITPKSGEFGGTHNYRGEWSVLDHIMVSKGFCGGKGYRVQKKSGKINSFGFLLTEYKGNTVPFRTYGGGRYLEGYSDHLPVSINVNFK